MFLLLLSLLVLSIILPSLSYLSSSSSSHGYKHSTSSSSLYSTIDAASEFGLTPMLNKYVTGIFIIIIIIITIITIIIIINSILGLRNVPDEKLRYQQLLFLAAKCKPMDPSLKIDQNKVPGCLSTVHVHATIDNDNKITYLGDSDAQLTKGLVALLVNGLTGHTPEEIEIVKPEFIQYAGIANSLTPGRNNGFLNMLRLMKEKAKQLKQEKEVKIVDSSSSIKGGSIYQSMNIKLQMLKPSELVIEDESYKHAGHAGVKDIGSSETHFNVKIVATCFEGLSLVQRHRMIYTLLGPEMSQSIHALSIVAKTPGEI